MPALPKALGDITPADFEALIRDQWAESEQLEFKKTLSTAKGDSDKWLVDQSEIGVSAKRDILAEVVAMANSYGGDVIVGIDETRAKPPRASEIVSLPECVELAHRLEMSARDLIKPEIPLLSVRGIPVKDRDGVVVFRVPKSRVAPHRLELKGVEKECYKRVSDRTEPMSMREIQDLTFSVARGLEGIEAKFANLRTNFHQWAGARKTLSNRRWSAYRVSAVPMSADLYLPRIHNNANVLPGSKPVSVLVRGRAEQFHTVGDPYRWRPILRGTEGTEGGEEVPRLLRLYSDGVFSDMTVRDAPMIDQPGQRSDHVFYPGWYFGTVINSFRTVDRFRQEVGANGVQYAIDVEILTNAPLPVLRIGSTWHERAGTIAEGEHGFPRYQLGDRESWNDTLALMWLDFWNFIGVDPSGDELAIRD